MNIDEMKNKISMALKDPILQQGFEIICKENAELKAGRPEWHKVEEKLPPLWKGSEQISVKVVDNYYRIIIYDFDCKRWRDLEGDSLGIQPDYWCKIPIFNER